MDAIGLDGSGDVDQIFVNHGYYGGVVFGCQVEEEPIELQNVLLAVIGREGNAGEQDFDVRVIECCQHLVEVAAGFAERQSAQSVVAAELDDHDFRVQAQDDAETGDGILGGGAAGALIADCVAVAEAVEIPLKGVRKGLSGLQSVAGGNAVTIANEERPAGGQKRSSQ